MFKHATVTVMVTDLSSAIGFYQNTLGFPVAFESQGHYAEMQAPGLTIGLHPAGEHGPRPGKSESLSIGFEVDDITPAMVTLRERGVVFANISDDKATKLAYFSDPDGNPLYLVEVKPGARG